MFIPPLLLAAAFALLDDGPPCEDGIRVNDWRWSEPRLVQAGIYCAERSVFHDCTSGRPVNPCQKRLTLEEEWSTNWQRGWAVGAENASTLGWYIDLSGEYEDKWGGGKNYNAKVEAWLHREPYPCPGQGRRSKVKMTEVDEDDERSSVPCADGGPQNLPPVIDCVVNEVTVDVFGDEIEESHPCHEYTHLPTVYKYTLWNYHRYGSRFQRYSGGRWVDCDSSDCRPETYILWVVLHDKFYNLTGERNRTPDTFYEALESPSAFCTGTYTQSDKPGMGPGGPAVDPGVVVP